jgi:hypothetical protein
MLGYQKDHEFDLLAESSRSNGVSRVHLSRLRTVLEPFCQRKRDELLEMVGGFHAQLYTLTSMGSGGVGTIIYPNLDLNLGRLLKSIKTRHH